MPGSSLKVIEVINGRLRVILEGLTSVLQKCGDRKIIVLAIGGKMRTGKSLSISCILHYLMSEDSVNWIRSMVDHPNLKFEWKKDKHSVTKGVQVWSEPMLVQTSQGEVAVVLLDCQGAFDSNASMNDDNLMFAFCILMSSIMVYNVKGVITETDIDPFVLFMETALTAMNKVSGERYPISQSQKSFQTLIFLHRDSNDAALDPHEMGYYEKNIKPPGSTYDHFRKTFSALDRQKQESRARILSNFSQIGIFAMPSPTDPGADNIVRMGPPFNRSLTQFMERIFSPDNLVTKLIGGMQVDGPQLLIYFTELAKCFNDQKFPKIETLFQALASSQHLINKNQAMAHFLNEMTQFMDNHPNGIDQNLLKVTYSTISNQTLIKLGEQRLLGGHSFMVKYKEELVNEMTAAFEKFEKSNAERLKNDKIQQQCLANAEESLKIAKDRLEKAELERKSISDQDDRFYKTERIVERVETYGQPSQPSASFAVAFDNNGLKNLSVSGGSRKDNGFQQGGGGGGRSVSERVTENKIFLQAVYEQAIRSADEEVRIAQEVVQRAEGRVQEAREMFQGM